MGWNIDIRVSGGDKFFEDYMQKSCEIKVK